MKYYFDFDNTIVRTRHLINYMGNPKGREFLTANALTIGTVPVNERLIEIIQGLGSNAAVITNSPQAYAEAFLRKHGLPNIQVVGNAEKPCSRIFLDSPAVFIGDEPSDILFAHERKIPSIAYIEGGFFPLAKVEKAQPTAIARTVDDLERLLSENLVYEPRQIPPLILLDALTQEDIQIHSVQEYHPPKTPDFKKSGSELILAYKRIKENNWDEILKGKRDSFFYEGSLVGGKSFSWVINGLYARLYQKIQELNLQGTVRMLPIPNSLPEFCFLSDPNYMMAFTFNNQSGDRNLYRTKPVKESHMTSGYRNPAKHLGTLSITPNIDRNVDNMVLFDDITTSGSQFLATASLLRKAGYQNNIVGVALGKTIDKVQVILPPPQQIQALK